MKIYVPPNNVFIKAGIKCLLSKQLDRETWKNRRKGTKHAYSCFVTGSKRIWYEWVSAFDRFFWTLARNCWRNAPLTSSCRLEKHQEDFHDVSHWWVLQKRRHIPTMANVGQQWRTLNVKISTPFCAHFECISPNSYESEECIEQAI
jgi:hypothetical protein